MLPKINLDGANGHISISLALIGVGVIVAWFGGNAPAAGMGATMFGVGIARLERSLKKTSDGNGHGE